MSVQQIIARARRTQAASRPRAPTAKKPSKKRSARGGPKFIVDPASPDYLELSNPDLREFADHLNSMLGMVRATQKPEEVLKSSIWLTCLWEVAMADGLAAAQLQARHLWQEWDLSSAPSPARPW